MKLIKLMAILSVLAVFAFGCELDEEGADATGGTTDTGGGGTDTGGTVDPCPNCPVVDSSKYSLAADGSCNTALYYDIDCANEADGFFSYACGKAKCDFNNNVCEAASPCDAWWKLNDGIVVKPCSNDPDCVAAGGPPIPCMSDGHCDTWCPLNTDLSPLDLDCSPSDNDTAKYCDANGNLSCP